MRYHELLNEGVVLRGNIETVAYAITVAEAFIAAPDASSSNSWRVLAKHTASILFKQIANSGVKVTFTENDPYSRLSSDPDMWVRHMLWDMIINKRLEIFTGSSEHPALSPEENVIFRTVHDYYAHGILRSAVAQQMKHLAQNNPNPSDEELKKILPTVKLNAKGNIGHSFSYRGELNAYVTHSKLAPREATPALFTEIVANTSYFALIGDFPVTQKIAILDQFDYINVGKVIDQRAKTRMSDLISKIKKGEEIVSQNKTIDISAMMQRMVLH